MPTDTERLNFVARHALCVSANDAGEWQVFELAPKYYSDGIVTRNAFLGSARDAIDWAISFYLGGDNQYGDPRETVFTISGEDLDAIGSSVRGSAARWRRAGS